MTKNQYDQFDKALLEQIAAGRNTVRQLDTDASGMRALAEPYRLRGLFGGRVPAVRIIDLRLQALRKRGLIRFNGKAWVEAS